MVIIGLSGASCIDVLKMFTTKNLHIGCDPIAPRSDRNGLIMHIGENFYCNEYFVDLNHER